MGLQGQAGAGGPLPLPAAGGQRPSGSQALRWSSACAWLFSLLTSVLRSGAWLWLPLTCAWHGTASPPTLLVREESVVGIGTPQAPCSECMWGGGPRRFGGQTLSLLPVPSDINLFLVMKCF